MSQEEMTELMVAASQLEGGEVSHAIVRDAEGNALAIYPKPMQAEPIERQVDWWLGPLLLVLVLLMVIGAFTLARGFVAMLF